MAPKKKTEKVEEEVPQSEDEPEEPEILIKCLRAPGQLYYGDCKAGYHERKGRWIRHGKGLQVVTAVAPMPHAFETVVLSSYEGQWEEDQPDGEGSYKWSDGSSYEGQMEEGKMHGQGRYVWPDGSSYEGSWFQGALHGQGRFDSRFDGGRYMQGQFHYNCFQKSDGSWVDILQHIKSHELREILEGNPLTQRVEPETAKKTKTKATKTTKGSTTPWSSAGFASVIHCTPEPGKNLGKCIREALKSNLVPFLVAEESCMCHALEALLAADVMTEPSAQCVSMRLAALEQRRQRDYKRFFRNALQSSILSGSCIALVFEDDTPVELGEDEWLQRIPSKSAMEALPDEWSLSCFFNSSALPPEIFAPMTFNTRGKAPLLLPNGSDNGVLPLESEPAETTPAPSQDLMFRAAGELPESGVGSTGHLFQATEEEMKSRDPKDTTSFLGLPLHYQVHPVVLAQGRMPDAMEDAEVRKWVKQRFGKHAPMHRLAVVVLTAPQEEETA